MRHGKKVITVNNGKNLPQVYQKIPFAKYRKIDFGKYILFLVNPI
jgi:hypothetical protein